MPKDTQKWQSWDLNPGHRALKSLFSAGEVFLWERDRLTSCIHPHPAPGLCGFLEMTDNGAPSFLICPEIVYIR